jgi:glucose uptake protein GlcU
MMMKKKIFLTILGAFILAFICTIIDVVFHRELIAVLFSVVSGLFWAKILWDEPASPKTGKD